MFENEADVQKLKDFIKKKFPKLSNEEIEKRANQFSELGYFLVHLPVAKQTKNNSP